MSIAERISDLLTEARYRLESGKRALAVELTEQASRALENLDPSHPQRGEACADLSAMLRDLGDHQRCETLVKEAIALETSRESPQQIILGTRQLFYAMFLHDRGRLAEAAEQAAAGVASYARGTSSEDKELGVVREMAAKIIRDAQGHPAS